MPVMLHHPAPFPKLSKKTPPKWRKARSWRSACESALPSRITLSGYQACSQLMPLPFSCQAGFVIIVLFW